MNSNEQDIRIDVVQRIIGVDEKSGEFEVIIEPHPRRYEWKESKGERFLYDKFDNTYIPEKVFFDIVIKSFNKLPVSYQRQAIDSSADYAKSRIDAIRESLRSKGSSAVSFNDKSQDFLNSLEKDRLRFAILSVDLASSTQLSISLRADDYGNVISTFLFELSEVVPKFNGHVLKYTGDGLIAYFPEPSFIRMCDFAIDCAFAMHLIVYQALNPVLQECGYDPINVRIGIEAGEAYLKVIGSPETKQHKDIIGSLVSLTTKIQSVAEIGQITLGNTAIRNLHTMWREVCEEYIPSKDFPYHDTDGSAYKLYRLIPGKKIENVF